MPLLFFLESIISKLVSREISIFYLVAVAEETGLSLALSETPKTGFVASRPRCIWQNLNVFTQKTLFQRSFSVI